MTMGPEQTRLMDRLFNDPTRTLRNFHITPGDMPTPEEVHGDGNCHICGKPKAGLGNEICSYPHGMVPDQPVDDSGMWTWKLPEGSADPGQ